MTRLESARIRLKEGS